MEKVESFELVLDELKNGAKLTVTGGDRFYQSGETITRLDNGSKYRMNKDDFIALFHNNTFYYYEDNSVFIDDLKDEDYYRYYKK